jgi:lipoprotein-anchoring transpeptidase ErfK/SrfK
MRFARGQAVLAGALGALAVPGAAAAQAPEGTYVSSFRAPGAVVSGERVAVSGRVAPPVAVPLVVERLEGGAWSPLATVRSSPDGRFASRLPLRRSGNLRVSVQAGDGLASSRRRFVKVRRRVSLSVAAPPLESIAGRRFTARGAVVPSARGERVVLEGSVDGGPFRVIRRMPVRAGRVAATFTPPRGGSWRFRLSAAPRAGRDSGGAATTGPMRVLGANPHRVPASAEHYLVQRISEMQLYYYQRGRLRRVFPVVFGKPSTPTPVGRYRVYSKTNGPGPAFGPKALWYHRGYGIHGTNQEHLLSHRSRYYSAGCTRNYNVNILWLYERVPVGTPVLNLV